MGDGVKHDAKPFRAGGHRGQSYAAGVGRNCVVGPFEHLPLERVGLGHQVSEPKTVRVQSELDRPRRAASE